MVNFIEKSALDKIVEKADEMIKSGNTRFIFPEVRLSNDEMRSAFSEDKVCSVITQTAGKNLPYYLEIISALNPDFLKKLENVKVMRGLKMEDSIYFSTETLMGNIGDYFLSLENPSKKALQGQNIWMRSNDERILTAVSKGFTDLNALTFVTNVKDNQKYVNLVLKGLDNSLYILDYAHDEVLNNPKVISKLFGMSIANIDVYKSHAAKKLLKNVDKDSEEVFNYLFDSVQQEPDNLNNIYATYGVDFAKKFIPALLDVVAQGGSTKNMNRAWILNNIETPIDNSNVWNWVSKSIMYMNNYGSANVDFNNLAKQMDVGKIFENSSLEQKLALISDVDQINQDPLRKKVMEWVSNDGKNVVKEAFSTELFMSVIDICKPVTMTLQEMVPGYMQAYMRKLFVSLRDEEYSYLSQTFQDAEWVGKNMENETFREAYLKTVGGYAEMGKMLAKDEISYDGMEARYPLKPEFTEGKLVKQMFEKMYPEETLEDKPGRKKKM